MKILIGDIETNGIKDPSQIWMVGVLDYFTDEYTSYHGEDVPLGLLRLMEAELVIGHYFKGYDAKHIKRLTNGLIVFDNDRIIDTCDLSRALCKELPDHKLKTWGEILGFPKLEHKDFDRYSEEMDVYCERDCRVNKRIFDFLLEAYTEPVLQRAPRLMEMFSAPEMV